MLTETPLTIPAGPDRDHRPATGVLTPDPRDVDLGTLDDRAARIERALEAIEALGRRRRVQELVEAVERLGAGLGSTMAVLDDVIDAASPAPEPLPVAAQPRPVAAAPALSWAPISTPVVPITALPDPPAAPPVAPAAPVAAPAAPKAPVAPVAASEAPVAADVPARPRVQAPPGLAAFVFDFSRNPR